MQNMLDSLTTHEDFMLLAIEQAHKAASMDEVPIGAVIVCDGKVVAVAHNERESSKDPTAHAEIVALRRAGEFLGRWNLSGCTMYVTLEPCPMCAGALVAARVDTLVYGTADPKAGAVHTLYTITTDERLNHRLKVVSGVLENECSNVLKEFFRSLREKKKQAKNNDS